MSEWKKVKLGEVVSFNPKERLPKNTNAKKIAMDKLVPFSRKISGYENSIFAGGTKFRNDDTIMARITPCLENGKTAYVSILDDDEIGFGSTEYIVFRKKDGISDSKFIYYFTINPSFRAVAIKSMVGSSGRQRVQQSVLENLIIDFPTFTEQVRIAEILGSLDDKIELNNRINKNLEEQAQALFKRWFVDFEFPDANGNPYKSSGGDFIDSELGEIPKGWKIGELGGYCKVKSGFAFKSSWWKQSGVKVLKIKNIQSDNTLNLNDCSFVAEDKVELATNFKVIAGDLLIAMTGATIGKFSIVPRTKDTLLVNQRVGKFFLGDNPIDQLPFIYNTLKQDSIIFEIINRGQGSAQPNISPSDIETIKIITPNNSIINTYNTAATPFFNLMINNNDEIQKLSNLRNSLLPKLMNNQIKL